MIVPNCAHSLTTNNLYPSLVGNEDGTLPTQKAIGEGEGSIELAEERRLCYVAMTRAKTHLVLTWRKEVSYFAGAAFRTKDAIRSRFLDVLMSKKGDKSKPRDAQGRSNVSSTEEENFKHKQVLGSTTKRELHSKANDICSRYSTKQSDAQTFKPK